MSSDKNGTFTVKLQGTGDTDVVTGTFTGTKKNIISLTITYDPSTSTARILKDGVELASGTLTNFTTGTDLLMANHFYTSESRGGKSEGRMRQPRDQQEANFNSLL